ncbi:MAG TPA: polysaccharide deacetylase family protein [Candidatus Nanoarchaeia archaeon]|nr:polysaccharide deacetylase family protein [Candidatus Nanoarchaeia archaeon]
MKMLVLLLILLSIPSVLGDQLEIFSTRSGFISPVYRDVSFARLMDAGLTSAGLMYFDKNGTYFPNSAVHYEWFDMSNIPGGSVIEDAVLYKYHDSSPIRGDINYKMVPAMIVGVNRVTLAKLTQGFTEDITYPSGYRTMENLGLVSTAATGTALVFNVTSEIQKYIDGEPNYGFAFLGNYNTGGFSSSRYYFRNSANKPKLLVKYKLKPVWVPACGDGKLEGQEECDDGNLIGGDGCSIYCSKESTPGNDTDEICQFAYSAAATSQNNLGSLASFAEFEPDAPKKDCNVWSGYGYSWTPQNWNIKANLTLKYKIPVKAESVTIYGDYAVCWDRVWAKDSATGETQQIFTGPNNTCELTIPANISFAADTLILETCGWSWSATDAVKLCGFGAKEPDRKVAICDWKYCRKGAASISVDDSFTSCAPELDAKGYKGTYFLSHTDTLTDLQWDELAALYKNGHEIGTHSRSHLCTGLDDSMYKEELEDNIQDITQNLGISRENIKTHSYPCGMFSAEKEKILKELGYSAARGYNINQLERPLPADLFNLKSYNTVGYPGGEYDPPSYIAAVDEAEKSGRWFSLVMHSKCSDSGVIEYLPKKDLWVDNIGNVASYIDQKQDCKITDYRETSRDIKFRTEGCGGVFMKHLIKGPGAVWMDGSPVIFYSRDGYIFFEGKDNAEVRITR